MTLNQLKIGVVISYFSTGLNMIIQLIYTPLMIHLLGQSEYGVYTLVGSVVSYLSLFSLGFTGAYLRYYSRYKARNDGQGLASLNGMFSTIFIAMALVALICGVVLAQYPRAIFGTKLTDQELQLSQVLMVILVINIALTLPSGLFESMVSAHEQFLFQRVLNLASIVLNPLISLPLLFMGYGSIAMVLVTTLITLAKLITNIYFCVHKLRVQFSFYRFDFSLLREIGGFSFFLFLNMIIDQINWSVDKFILGRISGSIAVAVYGVGAQINGLFTNFSVSISSVFSPRVNRIAAENSETKYTDLTKLMTRVGRIQLMVLALIASGFIIFGQYFITDIFATADYKDSYYVALLLIIPGLVPLIQNVGLEIQRALNQHQFRSIVYFFMALFNVLISIPLARKFGPNGAAAGTAIGMILANGLIMNIYYQKGIKLDIVFFWKEIISLSKGLIIPALVGGWINHFVHFDNLLAYLGLILVYILVYAFCIWIFGMNDEERDLIRQPLKRLWK